MRFVLVALVLVGCSRPAADIAETWRTGLTEEQISDVLKDKQVCLDLFNKLTLEAGMPEPGTIEYLALVRLKTHHDEFEREVRAGKLKTAAAYFRQQIEGKDLKELAWEQSAELPRRAN